MCIRDRDDGINEYGLAVTMTSCGIPVVDLPYMKTPCIEGLQYWIVVRALLENCRNVQEALSYIKDMPIGFHMNMIIFDKEEHAALIQTYAGKKAIRCITTEKALLFTTNHAVLDDDKHLESGALDVYKRQVDFRLRDGLLLIGMLALFAVVIWTSFQPISLF